MELLPLIIQLISGAVGGNLFGAIVKSLSLGTLGNSIAGILGGGIGGTLLSSLGLLPGGGSMDLMGIISQVLSGGAGGGVLMLIVGILRKLFAR